jgi:hypothetical protein
MLSHTCRTNTTTPKLTSLPFPLQSFDYWATSTQPDKQSPSLASSPSRHASLPSQKHCASLVAPQGASCAGTHMSSSECTTRGAEHSSLLHGALPSVPQSVLSSLSRMLSTQTIAGKAGCSSVPHKASEPKHRGSPRSPHTAVEATAQTPSLQQTLPVYRRGTLSCMHKRHFTCMGQACMLRSRTASMDMQDASIDAAARQVSHEQRTSHSSHLGSLHQSKAHCQRHHTQQSWVGRCSKCRLGKRLQGCPCTWACYCRPTCPLLRSYRL